MKTTSLVVFELCDILIIRMFYIRENLKKVKTCKGGKNVVPLKNNINWDSICCFSETKPHHEVASKLGKCQSLLGKKQNKKEFIFIKSLAIKFWCFRIVSQLRSHALSEINENFVMTR